MSEAAIDLLVEFAKAILFFGTIALIFFALPSFIAPLISGCREFIRDLKSGEIKRKISKQ